MILSYWQSSMDSVCVGLVYCTMSYVHVENPFVSLNSSRWRKFKILTVGFSAEQQRKEKKIVLKRSLCDFVNGAAFQEYFWEKGKGQLFTSQRDAVELMLVMRMVCFLFSIQNACFLHPFCDCLLRSKDLCCHWCQIILCILFEFFEWSEFLASFMAMKHLTS